MNKEITIGKLLIGTGQPKICVSLTGKGQREIEIEVQNLRCQPIDLIEWRIDYFESCPETDLLTLTLESIKATLPEHPLIFTFRTLDEGGQKPFDLIEYKRLYQWAINCGRIDAIDLELQKIEGQLEDLIAEAKTKRIAVVVSHHNFSKTPARETMKALMHRAVELGADIPKLAVMPQTHEDVLQLLELSQELKKNLCKPFITISMGNLGEISRLLGKFTGSAVTFGSAGEASAPGQIPVAALQAYLNFMDTCE